MSQNYIESSTKSNSDNSFSFNFLDINWNFFEADGVKEKDEVVKNHPNRAQALVNKKNEGLLHVNPFKESIFRSSSYESHEFNLILKSTE